LFADNTHLKAVFVLKPKSDADVYAERTIATYETQYRDNPMAKPQEITLTITNKHLSGKAFVCEQIATQEEDIFYSRFTANISDIAKISINTYIKELPIYISFERPNKKNKNAKDRKRIILPGFDHPENIVAQITEAKEKLYNFNKNISHKGEDSRKQEDDDRKAQEAFDRMSDDDQSAQKAEHAENTDNLLCGADKIDSPDEIKTDAAKIDSPDEIKADAASDILEALDTESIDIDINDGDSTFDAEAFDEPVAAENDTETDNPQSEETVNAEFAEEAVQIEVTFDGSSESVSTAYKKTAEDHKPPVAPAPPSGSFSIGVNADEENESADDEVIEASKENTYIQDYTYLANKSGSETALDEEEEIVQDEISVKVPSGVVVTENPVIEGVSEQTEIVSEPIPEKGAEKKNDKKTEKKQKTQTDVKSAETESDTENETLEKMTLEEFEQAMRKLKIMYETGVITEDEYAEEKKRIIKTLY
jgi:hypothetical protein